jgi:hypothetical protein
LRQHGCIDPIGLDLGLGDQMNLPRISDGDAPHVRTQHIGHRHGIAGRLKDDDVIRPQLLGKCCKGLIGYTHPSLGAEHARLKRYHLGKTAMNIQPQDAHRSAPSVCFSKCGSRRATRHLQIRARSASGKVVKGRPKN